MGLTARFAFGIHIVVDVNCAVILRVLVVFLFARNSVRWWRFLRPKNKYTTNSLKHRCVQSMQRMFLNRFCGQYTGASSSAQELSLSTRNSQNKFTGMYTLHSLELANKYVYLLLRGSYHLSLTARTHKLLLIRSTILAFPFLIATAL